MKQKNNRIKWKKLPKRVLAVGLTVAMLSNMVDLSTLPVDAQSTEEELTIVAFDSLSKDIREQKLEIGASEDDINFPDTLTVTVEKIQTVEKDDKEAETESTEETTEATESTETEAESTESSTEQTTEMSEETDEGSSSATEASTQTSEETSSQEASQESGSEETSSQTTAEEMQKADEDSMPADSQEEKAEEAENEEARNSGSFSGVRLSALADNLLPHKMIVHAAETKPESEDETTTQTEKIRLTDIQWKINASESDAEEFNSSKKYSGFCYVYTPVLPDTDKKGNKLVLGEDVELPMIYVLVGEYGIATLDNELVEVSINDTTTGYATLQEACEAISGAVETASAGNTLDITLKILQTIKLDSGYNWTLDGGNKNITLTVDLNGQEIGYYKDTVWGGSGTNALNMHFQNITVILTDKSSSNGKLHGTFYVENYSNFTLDNTYCQVLQIWGGTTVLEGGECPNLYVGSLKPASNENARCQIKGGTYGNIVVYGGAELSIEGDASVRSIYALHYIQSDANTYKDVKATVNLRGGTYTSVTTSPRNAEDAKDESKGYALSNMLATGYDFVSQDNSEHIDLTDKTLIRNVKVVPVAITITKQPSIAQNKSAVLEYYAEADAPKLTIAAESAGELTYQWYQTTSDGTESSATETAVSGATESTYQIPAGLTPGTYQYDCTVSCGESSVKSDAVTFTVTQAVVKIVETKADGTTKETYYADWADAMTYLSYSGEGEFEGVEKAEVILLQDTKCSGISSVQSIGDFAGQFPKEVIIRSEGECHELSGGTVLKAVYDTTHVYMKNIKVEGSIALSGGATLTLDEKTEVVAKSKADTFEVKESKLIIGDAKVSAGIELISGSTLEVKQGAVISGPSGALDEQIKVTNTGNTAVLGAGAATPVFYGDGELSIYCKNDTADWSASLKTTGNKKIWYPITLPEGVTLPTDGENASVVSVYNGDTYGLYQNGDTTDHSINVPGQICSYYLTKDGNNNLQKISDSKFTMPAAAVTLLGHNTDEYGVCANCGRTDLAKAYENGHLHVEGLTGRTYDSYPQILSNITLDTADGSKTLTAPSYYNERGILALNSPIGVGGDNPLNSAIAEYVVHYKNNADIYTLTQGEAGFDEAKAPQVTIKGRGNYTGEVTIYFTIGKGTARLGDINVCINSYCGYEQPAWSLIPLQFEADPSDQYQFAAGLTDGKYIPVCSEAEANNWYKGGTYISNYKIEYSTDDQKTWITEKEFGTTVENAYMITDAGEYPFYLRITGGNGLFDTLTSEKCIARITPRDLSLLYGITVDVPEDLVAYYTGKPVLPASGYQLKDRELYQRDADGNLITGYTLVKDTDFTVSGLNNTDITDDATLIFTGKGNYRGEIQADNKFAIKYAFSPAQTTVSKDHWYNGDVPVKFSEQDESSDAEKIVYKGNVEAGAGLSDNLNAYASLEEAINGSALGYTFTSEGKNTQTLYIKDEDNGYISTSVDVTVQIDKTAPVWEGTDGSSSGYGIQIKENWWKKLLNTISFDQFYNDETLEIKIRANDEKAGIDTSGLDQYFYYIEEVSDENAIDNYKVKTAEELDQLSFVGVAANGASAVTAGSLSKDANYVVYAYAVDKAGNKSEYICTEGIVRDTAILSYVINAPNASTGTLDDTEGTFSFEAPEDLTLLYFYVHANEFDSASEYEEFVNDMKDYYTQLDAESSDKYLPLAKKGNDDKWVPNFTSDGDKAQVSFGYSGREITLHTSKVPKGNYELTISDLQPSEACTVWMVSIDRAGNISSSPFMSFTTTKALPWIAAVPVLTGFYGDKPQDLTITTPGVAEYGDVEIQGEWKITEKDTTPLGMNTTTTCQVTFIPDASLYPDQFENHIFRVRPVIKKRPITIRVADMTVGYGENIPRITDGDFDIVTDGESKGLVGSDTKETIQNTLSLETSSTSGSDCGEYPFTVSSDSGNYEVTAKYYENLSDLSNPKTEGTLTITKAAGEIIQNEGFTASKTVVYGDPDFSLNVSSNNKEGKLIYEVSNSKDMNGVDVEDDWIVSVSDDGKVTVKSPGSAKIKIYLPATKNYTAVKTPLTVDVTVNKKAYTAEAVNRKYLYSKENEDAIDLLPLLPKDCGSANFGAISTADSSLFTETPQYKEGKLAYKLATGNIGKKITITVPIITDNYIINGNNTLTINLELVEHKPLKPQGEITLQKNEMTYGESWSVLQFNEAKFVDEDTGEEIVGTLAWNDPDYKPEVGERLAEWTFTPDNVEYASYIGYTTVTVNKAVPHVVLPPDPSEQIYRTSAYSREILNGLSKNTGIVIGVDNQQIGGIWKWEDVNWTPTVGQSERRVYFEPLDTQHYENSAMETVTLIVKKARPYIQIGPQVSDYTHGDILYSQNVTGTVIYGDGRGNRGSDDAYSNETVSGTFTWVTADMKLSYQDDNGKTCEYVFTPADTASYETVKGTFTITVNKAQNPPQVPDSVMNVSFSCKKVSDVKLPAGWEWTPAEGQDTALTVGNSITVTATYTASDSVNYENVKVDVAITRSSCEHAKTERRGEVKATCAATGSTGELWCLVCGEMITGSTEIEKDPTNHVALTSKVTKQPTTTEEGVMTYECSACGYTATKPIAKITGSSNEPESSSESSGSSNNVRKNVKQPTKPTPDPSLTPILTPDPIPDPAQPAQPVDNVKKPQRNVSAAQNDTVEEGKEARPFIQGEEGKEGWDVIKAESTACAEGGTIVVDMNGSGVVPGSIFDTIRGRDITIEFKLDNGISWQVNGKSVQKENISDIDFHVALGEDASDTIPVDLINALTGERSSMNVTLAYDGAFGFEAIMCLNVGEANKGLVANLFYYNVRTDALEFICADEIDETGLAELIFTHASDYTIILDTASMEPVEETDESLVADTTGDNTIQAATTEDTTASDSGDHTLFIWLIILACIAALTATGFLTLKKRKEE